MRHGILKFWRQSDGDTGFPDARAIEAGFNNYRAEFDVMNGYYFKYMVDKNILLAITDIPGQQMPICRPFTQNVTIRIVAEPPRIEAVFDSQREEFVPKLVNFPKTMFDKEQLRRHCIYYLLARGHGEYPNLFSAEFNKPVVKYFQQIQQHELCDDNAQMAARIFYIKELDEYNRIGAPEVDPEVILTLSAGLIGERHQVLVDYAVLNLDVRTKNELAYYRAKEERSQTREMYPTNFGTSTAPKSEPPPSTTQASAVSDDEKVLHFNLTDEEDEWGSPPVLTSPARSADENTQRVQRDWQWQYSQPRQREPWEAGYGYSPYEEILWKVLVVKGMRVKKFSMETARKIYDDHWAAYRAAKTVEQARQMDFMRTEMVFYDKPWFVSDYSVLPTRDNRDREGTRCQCIKHKSKGQLCLSQHHKNQFCPNAQGNSGARAARLRYDMMTKCDTTLKLCPGQGCGLLKHVLSTHCQTCRIMDSATSWHINSLHNPPSNKFVAKPDEVCIHELCPTPGTGNNKTDMQWVGIEFGDYGCPCERKHVGHKTMFHMKIGPLEYGTRCGRAHAWMMSNHPDARDLAPFIYVKDPHSQRLLLSNVDQWQLANLPLAVAAYNIWVRHGLIRFQNAKMSPASGTDSWAQFLTAVINLERTDKNVDLFTHYMASEEAREVYAATNKTCEEYCTELRSKGTMTKEKQQLEHAKETALRAAEESRVAQAQKAVAEAEATARRAMANEARSAEPINRNLIANLTHEYETLRMRLSQGLNTDIYGHYNYQTRRWTINREERGQLRDKYSRMVVKGIELVQQLQSLGCDHHTWHVSDRTKHQLDLVHVRHIDGMRFNTGT